MTNLTLWLKGESVHPNQPSPHKSGDLPRQPWRPGGGHESSLALIQLRGGGVSTGVVHGEEGDSLLPVPSSDVDLVSWLRAVVVLEGDGEGGKGKKTFSMGRGLKFWVVRVASFLCLLMYACVNMHHVRVYECLTLALALSLSLSLSLSFGLSLHVCVCACVRACVCACVCLTCVDLCTEWLCTKTDSKDRQTGRRADKQTERKTDRQKFRCTG